MESLSVFLVTPTKRERCLQSYCDYSVPLNPMSWKIKPFALPDSTSLNIRKNYAVSGLGWENQKGSRAINHHLNWSYHHCKSSWSLGNRIISLSTQQHLKIKTFVGTSPNALKTQIWTALMPSSCSAIFNQIKYNLPFVPTGGLIRLNLFSYRTVGLARWSF